MCQPVGPFRMMARDGTKVELIPATGMVVMLLVIWVPPGGPVSIATLT